ncbi:MAG TPA: AMP-binding protein [Smithellaceae bacterium]|nr:AMP-binding protein [Smithellaceae bacterium]
MKKFYDAREKSAPSNRKALQDKALSAMVKLGYKKSPAFKKILDLHKINPAKIKCREDLEILPVISREKLVEMQLKTPPYAGLQNPQSAVDRIFTSPGPVYEPHLSESDYLWARAFCAAGIGPDDVALNAFSYHLVAAGLTFHAGLRKVGATVVPSGTSSSQVQVQLIRDLGVTAYVGTPSFLASIISQAKEMGYHFKKDFKVKKACFAAEPLLPSLRETFEKEYGIDTYQMYGATEVGDVAYECSQKNGWHLCEETVVEIVDPSTGRSVAPGELGEVVVTRLNPIFFLVRFGTGDLSRLMTQKCRCGRSAYRLAGIAGRVGEAVKVRGLFVAPSQLKLLASKVGGAAIQAVVDRRGHEDHLTVRLEKSSVLSDKEGERFKKLFREICTVRIDELEFVESGVLTSGEKLIVDRRNW